MLLMCLRKGPEKFESFAMFLRQQTFAATSAMISVDDTTTIARNSRRIGPAIRRAYPQPAKLSGVQVGVLIFGIHRPAEAFSQAACGVKLHQQGCCGTAPPRLY